MNETRVLVTGGAGFIGHHLTNALKRRGYWVRAIDIKPPEFGALEADEFVLLDMRRPDDAAAATCGVDHVYALAADMGGMGYISQHDARILHDNSLINLNTVETARSNGASRLLYASSACIYPEYRQDETDVTPLAEEHAYPAQPQDAYGWEKLISERLCIYYRQDFGLETRIVRFHNIYGPEGTWDGGREKAPAALSRKIATAKLTGRHEIEIWGDGEQTRSFCYIDDCLEGIHRLMQSDHHEPLNLGQDRLVSINDLAYMIAAAAEWPVTLRHVPGPQGVRGRNSDNTRLRRVLGWEPAVTLEDGLASTYAWIESQVAARLKLPDPLMSGPTDTIPPSAVSVVGLGKLGLPLAACLSASGFRTIGVDVIARNVAEINAGRSPILEPGLAELVRAHGGSALRATTNIREAIAETDVTFIIVPTPSDESGGFSNALLREAIGQIGAAVSDGRRGAHLVVVSSTVMPGSIDRELGPLLAASSGRTLGDGIDICYDPDFISLGEVVRGLREPELVLIGEHRTPAGDIVEAIHRRMATNKPHVARMSVVSAEITKLALNAYVTMKISFANNLANICSGIAGADVDAVTTALGADSRISPRYLAAGLSFGGTCFPRDTVAFRRLAACAGTTAPLMEATEQVNLEHARRLSALVIECQRRSGGTVAVLGLAFRHDTPVTTVSPSIALVRDLLDAGIHVIGCDPMAAESARQELDDSIEYAATPAGALARSTVAVLTHRSRAFADAIESFEPAAPLAIVDCWRMIDPGRVRRGVSVVPFGRWIG